jgi:hypothetical protein
MNVPILQSNSLAHFRERKAIISFRPVINSERFLHRESIVDPTLRCGHDYAQLVKRATLKVYPGAPEERGLGFGGDNVLDAEQRGNAKFTGTASLQQSTRLDLRRHVGWAL